MGITETICLLIAGSLGALSKDIFKDNRVELPKILNGHFYMGFLGGMIIGGATGYLVDGSFLTAFMAGFTGSAILPNLAAKQEPEKPEIEESIEDQIRKIAKQECVDPDLAVRVAKCESNLNPSAVNENAPDSIDRGLFQINTKWHPEVTQAQAYDIEFATRFFCKAFKEGHLSWWDATKKCWNK